MLMLLTIYLPFAGGVGVAQHWCSGEVIETAIFARVESCGMADSANRDESTFCENSDQGLDHVQQSPCCDDQYHQQKIDDGFSQKLALSVFYVFQAAKTFPVHVEVPHQALLASTYADIRPPLPSGRDLLNHYQRYLI